MPRHNCTAGIRTTTEQNDCGWSDRRAGSLLRPPSGTKSATGKSAWRWRDTGATCTDSFSANRMLTPVQSFFALHMTGAISRILRRSVFFRMTRQVLMRSWGLGQPRQPVTSIKETALPLLTYLFTPWSRGFPKKLTSPQQLKKFSAFCTIWRFITAFTTARHLSLSWVRSIQSMPHPTSLKSILILSSHLRLGLPSGLRLFLNKTIYQVRN